MTRVPAKLSDDIHDIFNSIRRKTHGKTTSDQGGPEKLPTTALRQELLRLAPCALLDRILTEESYSAETIIDRLLEAKQEMNEEDLPGVPCLETDHTGSATSGGLGGTVHPSHQCLC